MAERFAALLEQSALPAGGRVLAETLHLAILPARAVVLLKLGARAQGSAGEIRIAGRPLPLAVNRWSGDDPVFCRVGPDAWLLVSAQHGAGDLMEAVRLGCKRRSCAATDISDANVTLAIEGPQAADLLARGCGLDLADAAFGQDACARTRLAQLPVVLRRVSHERFELTVDRSAAQWLLDWLQDAAAGVV
jgi:heterotetrameric sarcosine oxidase gamma subunit